MYVLKRRWGSKHVFIFLGSLLRMVFAFFLLLYYLQSFSCLLACNFIKIEKKTVGSNNKTSNGRPKWTIQCQGYRINMTIQNFSNGVT